MDQHGTINHIAITVSDLNAAMTFFTPFLEFFGYEIGPITPYAGTRFCVNLHPGHEVAINIWEAKAAHPFAVYEPGLHHLAFNAGSKEQVQEAHALVRDAGLEILDGPGEFPFADAGYYAFYFLGPDNLKLEVVHMPELDNTPPPK